MTTSTSNSPIILIAGYWLGAWAWDEVLEWLKAEGSHAVAMTLPGLDPEDPARAEKTLEDQVAAILDQLSELEVSERQPATLVAHSGANAPVSVVLDRNPELVHRVVWVDSGPMAAGGAFDANFPAEAADFPLPPFEVLAPHASLEGLSAESLERFRTRAVAEPGAVVRQPVELTNDARRSVATTLVCCSISGAQVLELAHAGNAMFSEVAHLEDVDVIDLPTGHWPMWSRPGDLAQIIATAASRRS